MTYLLLLNNLPQNTVAYYLTVSLGHECGSGLSECFWLRVFDKAPIKILARAFVIAMLNWGRPTTEMLQPRPLVFGRTWVFSGPRWWDTEYRNSQCKTVCKNRALTPHLLQPAQGTDLSSTVLHRNQPRNQPAVSSDNAESQTVTPATFSPKRPGPDERLIAYFCPY